MRPSRSWSRPASSFPTPISVPSCGPPRAGPSALYLAALAVTAGARHRDIGVTFTGDDRFMGDYLRAELLDRVSPADVSFLTRTAILEQMSGPLCDAVVGGTRSSAILERLEGRNLLVVPLDRRREWYRYHHLFRELLLSELRRREPGMLVELHLRAAAWCEANGLPESAIDHAQAAGDADRVARLVLQLANTVWVSGRSDTVMRWMEWFEQGSSTLPAIAVHGALMFALAGSRWHRAWAVAADVRDRYARTATRWRHVGYLRALLCRDGGAMRRDADRLDGSGRPARTAPRCSSRGRSYLLEGDLGGRTRSSPERWTRRPAPAPRRRSPCSSPSGASWRSNATTGPRSRPSLPRRLP